MFALSKLVFAAYRDFFWHLSLWNVSWAVVALKIFFGAFLFENCFFGVYRCKSGFFVLFASIWKWFFAIVSVKIIFGSSRYKKCLSLTSLKIIFVLVALNLILGASRFENFLSLLWKCLFGGHRFENSFLALLVLKVVLWHLSFFENFLRL